MNIETLKISIKYYTTHSTSIPCMTCYLAVLDDLRRGLRDSYKDILSHITRIPWDPSNVVPIDHIFVDPDLTKDKTTIAGFASEYIDSLDDILSEMPTRVLLKGVAGSGKTTLINWVTTQWTKRKGPLAKYDLTLVVKLRDVQRDTTVVDYVMDELLPYDGFTVAHRLYLRHCLRHSDHSHTVALVFDGLDEVNSLPREVKDIIEKRTMSHVTVLLTTRDWKETTVNRWFQHVIELQGISDSKLPTFIAKYLGEDSATNTERFLREARNANIEDMLRVPFYCICLVLAWLHHSYELPKSRTLLYSTMIDMISVGFFNKVQYDQQNLATLPPELKELHATLSPGLDPPDLLEALPSFPVLSRLGRLAFHGLLGDGKLYFTKEEVQSDVGDEVFQLGLLSQRKVYQNRRVKLQLKFPHKSLQEFSTAIYIVHLVRVTRDPSRVSEHEEAHKELERLWKKVMDSHFVAEFSLVFVSCCGLSLDTAEVTMQEMARLVLEDAKTQECRGHIITGTLVSIVVSNVAVQHIRYVTNTVVNCHYEAMQHPGLTPERRTRLTESAARVLDGCMVIFAGRSNLQAFCTFLKEYNAIQERSPLTTVLLVWKEDVGDPSELVKLLPVSALSCFWFMPRTTFSSDGSPMSPSMPHHHVQSILVHLSKGSQLRQLILIRVDLSKMSMFLAECLRGNKRLERLSLIANKLSLSGTPSLVEAINQLPLTCIDLARNTELQALASNVPATIEKLYLVLASLDSQSWGNLRTKLPQLINLKILYLSDNPNLGMAFRDHPPDFSRAPALEAVFLDRCGLDAGAVQDLLPRMAKVKTLTTLDLSGNGIQFDSSLVEFVSSTPQLQWLYITGNNVSLALEGELRGTQEDRLTQGKEELNVDIFCASEQWRQAWYAEYNQAFADF